MSQFASRLNNMRAQRAVDFNSMFWADVAGKLNADKGVLDVENRVIKFPKTKLVSQDSLWNKFVDLSQSRGVKPDYLQFMENYNKFKTAEDNKYVNLIQKAEQLGFSKRSIKDIIKNDEDADKRLTNLYLKTSDPNTLATLQDYEKKKFQFGDLPDMMRENPKTTAAGIIGGGLALRYGAPALGRYTKGKFTDAKDFVKSKIGTKDAKKPVAKKPKKTYITKAAITREYQKYLNNYEGDRTKRLSKRDFEKQYRAEQKAKGAKSKSTSKPKGKGKIGRFLTAAGLLSMLKD